MSDPHVIEQPEALPVVACSDLLGSEYKRLKITVGEHMKLSSPVLVNVMSGIMHAIGDGGHLTCHQCRTLPQGSNSVDEIIKSKNGYAVLEYVSRMPYIACRVCEQRA